jgi:hypothetical protein
MRNLDETIWLPHIWFFLYTVAHSYPDTPNKVTKRKYYDFIQNLPLYFPHERISNQFSHLLDAFPVTPYLENKDSFTYWVHCINNKLNRELGKEERTYLQHLDAYYNEYLPKQIKISEKLGIQRKYIIFGFIVICMFFIIMYYT